MQQYEQNGVLTPSPQQFIQPAPAPVPVAPQAYQQPMQPMQQPQQFAQPQMPQQAPTQQYAPPVQQYAQPPAQAPVAQAQPAVSLPQEGVYEFQVSKATVYKDKMNKFGKTADELVLDVVLLGTSDPANNGQPFFAKINGANMKVKTLTFESQGQQKETNLNKLFRALGINLPGYTPGTSINVNGLESLYGVGMVKNGQKSSYIRMSDLQPLQNPEYIAQNQSRAQFLTQ